MNVCITRYLYNFPANLFCLFPLLQKLITLHKFLWFELIDFLIYVYKRLIFRDSYQFKTFIYKKQDKHIKKQSINYLIKFIREQITKNINSSMQIISFLVFIVLLSLVESYVKSEKLEYFLVRPIRYFYKKLQLKLDINPILSHITHTNQQECNSKQGPFCGFINHRNMKDSYVKNIPIDHQNGIASIKLSLNEVRRIAQEIQLKKKEAFLVSNQPYKSYDSFIDTVLADQFAVKDSQTYKAMIGSKYQDWLDYEESQNE